MTILITGAAGFIGCNLARFMLNKGFKVIGVDNFLNGFRENLTDLEKDNNFSFHAGEVNTLGFDEIVRKNKIDCIYHLAARGSVPASLSDPTSTFNHNTKTTHNLLITAIEQKIERVVIASSASVYGESPHKVKHEHLPTKPINPYGLSKAVGEQYAQMFNRCYRLNVACTRFFNVYGPYQRPNVKYPAVIPSFIDAVMKGKAITINGDGQNIRDFTFVDDVCEALYRFLLISPNAWAGKSYNVSRNSETSVNDLAILIKEACDVDELIINRVSERAGDIKTSIGDNDKLHQDLNYRPDTTLKTGLIDTVKWYKGVYL